MRRNLDKTFVGLVLCFAMAIYANAIVSVYCWQGQCMGECHCNGTAWEETGQCQFQCYAAGQPGESCGGWTGYPGTSCVPEGPGN